VEGLSNQEIGIVDWGTMERGEKIEGGGAIIVTAGSYKESKFL